ncbi:MAG: YihY family inner membrane protein [gamma proteobacterium symbiont of Bathyaustriella thionipta]|nr:YihY family inner membrane protein [gamma proteobacterium symbiont of Bathyaustriella thionipta]MCU7950926.1 YihY family inner membrane protein [gamma proteobacterium symbiont of Bathyaustriella thionipta]MCU7952667.1 YihY family inner membrane protein [gamma proteobacterium symbiont of Bathyaustriella thionipta]MCU7957416.1 YihY family inner membrane protein [gamma proteobacterium symbiont of Bathyaustriella thionipta]MCU7967109.1 YihY family inner membrane protein [gamma proteobacterium sy
MKYFKISARFILFVIQRFLTLRCTEAAASLSYTSLLSLVPLLAVIFAGFSSFSVFQTLFEEIQQFIFANFVPSSSELIQQYLNEFVGKASRLTLIGLLGLFLVALMLMWQIDKTLNHIWGVNKTKNLLRTFLTYWAVLTLGPVLMGISLMVTSYIVSLPLITDAADTIGVRSGMLLMIPVVMTFLAFTLIYLIIPNTRVTLLHAMAGGMTATLFFELAKKGFALYVSHNTTYSSLYGALATVPIFLIWIYISWLVTLLGAVTTRSMSLFDFSLNEKRYSAQRFISAFHILRVLSNAAQVGEALETEKFHNDTFLHFEKYLDEILFELEELGWILKTENELWTLAKDLDNVTLWDFYQKLPYSLPKYHAEEPLSAIIGQSNKVLAQELDFPVKSVFSRYD